MNMPSLHKSLIVLVLLCRVTAVSASAMDTSANKHIAKKDGITFSVQFPTAFEQQTGQGKTPAEQQQQFVSSGPDGGLYMAAYQDLNNVDLSAPGSTRIALDILFEDFQKRVKGDVISKAEFVVPGGVGTKGIEFVLKTTRGRVRARSFIVGERWIMLLVEGDEFFAHASEATDFLKSGRLVKSQTRAQNFTKTSIPKRTTQQQSHSTPNYNYPTKSYGKCNKH